MAALIPMVLTINGGSSSIRFALYQTTSPLQRSLAGKVDRIGLPGTNLDFTDATGDLHGGRAIEASDHRSAAAFLLDFLEAQIGRIGAFAAALGRLDTLVFAGGIGENANEVRARACGGLQCLGIELDQAGNIANAPVISTASSRATVRVIRTDEELMIARAVCRLRCQEDEAK